MSEKIPMPHIELAVNLMRKEIRELKEEITQLREALSNCRKLNTILSDELDRQTSC